MARVPANNIHIEYEELGDRNGAPLLLIMGYAAQMTVWPDSFCQALVERGYRVIRFDNRDAGLSTHFDGVRAPGVVRSLFASMLNISLKTPYGLDDMAADAIGLLDALEIRDAHIVGASMGGMIAQLMAARHGARVRSLTSIMSTSGNRKLPPPRPRVLRHVLFKHRKNMPPDEMIGYLHRFWDLIASPAYPTPAAEKLRLIRAWVERDCDPQANIRQFAAMAANGDRSVLLRDIGRPTLIIHGEDDPLIRVEGGRHTADCIDDAQLQIIPGMGHDLPEALTQSIADMIAQHCSAHDVYADRSPQKDAALA